MSTQAECAPLSPVDTAYDDDFPSVANYMLSSNGSLTLQSSDASVQFSYGRALDGDEPFEVIHMTYTLTALIQYLSHPSPLARVA